MTRRTLLTSVILVVAVAFVAVQNLSFSIARGETFALVGESGSGKSTVARAISGLLAPASGQISMQGQPLPPLVRQRSAEQRRLIQYIFQNPDASLNPRARVGKTLARPLELFLDLDSNGIRHRIDEALSDTGLDAGYVERFPDQLSGGERQRVAIARALAFSPPVLLADEPTGNLDTHTGADILALIRDLHQRLGATVLIVTHDAGVAESCARTVTLRDARIAGDVRR